MELEFKKIEEKDKDQLFKLIDTVLSGLPFQPTYLHHKLHIVAHNLLHQTYYLIPIVHMV